MSHTFFKEMVVTGYLIPFSHVSVNVQLGDGGGIYLEMVIGLASTVCK
jgi:hypothetical protein